MKIVNKIMLSMLISGSTGYVMGMEDVSPIPEVAMPNLSNMSDEELKLICLRTISGLNLNEYIELKKVVAELCKKRNACKRFRNFLTTQKIAEFLLDKGLDVNAVDDQSYCRMFDWAVIESDLEVVKVLLEAMPAAKRASFVMAKNERGDTALYYAAFNGNVAIARALLAVAPPAEALMVRHSSDGTALHTAAQMGHPEIANVLIEAVPTEQRKAFIIAKDGSGHEALYMALDIPAYLLVGSGRVEVAKMLLEYYKRLGIKIPEEVLPQLKEHGIVLE